MISLNLEFNEGTQQPVPFKFGQTLHLQDSNGMEKHVTVINITGRSALLEYRDMLETKSKKQYVGN